MSNSDRLNILLVDDQPQRLLSYEAVLEPLGEMFVRAGSGREALDVLLRTDIAVMLIDVVMPEMDGFEITRLIRAHPRFCKLPIIFVTAVSTSDMERLKGYELGALDYVCVPIVPEILRAKVAVFLELYRTTRDLQQLNRNLERRVAERTRELSQTLAELEAHAGKLQSEIAERTRLEGELRQQARRLAESDRRKDAFLAMLAHELRNPLAPIRNSLEILKLPGVGREPAQVAREMIERQVEHLVRVVDDLLDVSRIMQGKIDILTERIDLKSVVDRATEMAQSTIVERGHNLMIDLPDQPLFVRGDLVRLAQVVCNLLLNAAKYTELAGDIWLTVRQEDNSVTVRVRDSGVGIPAELLPRIFDLFVQGERTLARSQGGLGIGLTLVRQLVELHGGTVSAASAGTGSGSEFTVNLPILRETESCTSAPTVEAAGKAEVSRRVLVVDDNVDAARSTAMLLNLAGHEVEVAHDGHAALESARKFRPELILLDIGLPGINGYEVAQLLRAEPELRHTFLAAVTGYGREADRQRSRQAGFDLHLTKPLGLDVLYEIAAGRNPALPQE